MRNLILRYLYLFYKYYDKGSTKSIAYTSALIALIMVLFLNIYSILIAFNVLQTNPNNSDSTPMYIKYLIGFGIFIPIFLFLKRYFKKEDVLRVEMDSNSIRKGYFIIVFYIILSILILIFIIQNK